MTRREHSLDPKVVTAMRNPSIELAMPLYEAFRRRMHWPYPLDATPEVAALACIHKARVRWAGASKVMIRESTAWLIEHGMSPDASEPRNLTIN